MIWACSVCIGSPDSPLTAGLNMGILSLLGVLTVVLGLFAKFFIHLGQKSKDISHGIH